MVLTTKLINSTPGTIIIREGVAGILRRLATIPSRESYNVRVELNITYKEFWCSYYERDAGDRVLITSDDCIDFVEINFKYDATRPHSKALYYEPRERPGKRGDSRNEKDSPLPTHVNSESWLTKVFKKKQPSAEATPPGASQS